jgi:CRP/FNR family transcriptional regulator
MKTHALPIPRPAASSILPPPLQRGGISEFRIEALRYFLRQQAPFRDLAEGDLRDLAAAAVVKSLPKDGYLFRRHETATGLFFVRRGIVNLHRVGSDGREVVIHFYREGELLAEIPDEQGDGCPADARAVVDSEVVIIPWRHFVEKSRKFPDLALRLLSAVEQQVHELAAAFEDFVSGDASTRFVHWLLRRCPNQAKAVEIDLGTTKRCLASELGVRQETLSRTLRQLSDSGYLRVNGRHITVNDPRALRSEWAGREACAAAA